MENTPEDALENLVSMVGKIRANCLLIVWAIEALQKNTSTPETEERLSVAFERIDDVLATVAERLDEVHQTLKEEKPAR
jgi:hypothetical protein